MEIAVKGSTGGAYVVRASMGDVCVADEVPPLAQLGGKEPLVSVASFLSALAPFESRKSPDTYSTHGWNTRFRYFLVHV